MPADKAEALAWEKRWALPVALAALAGVVLLVGSEFANSSITASHNDEVLRLVDQHGSDVVLATVLVAAGFILLAPPLMYLLRAARARSDRVRGQLVGVMIAAPLFFSLAAVLNSFAMTSAASEFVEGKASPTISRTKAASECRSELKEKGAKSFRDEFGGGGRASALGRCVESKISQSKADNAISSASARSFSDGFGLAGRLGFVFAIVYTSLWGLRTGLLSRFWGSLGIALGVVALFPLIQFTLIWFLYVGLLIAGWVPGGRPPAWAAGEAIPWPSPGERAAATLGEKEKEEPPQGGDVEPGERRKRKQRT